MLTATIFHEKYLDFHHISVNLAYTDINFEA